MSSHLQNLPVRSNRFAGQGTPFRPGTGCQASALRIVSGGAPDLTSRPLCAGHKGRALWSLWQRWWCHPFSCSTRSCSWSLGPHVTLPNSQACNGEQLHSSQFLVPQRARQADLSESPLTLIHHFNLEVSSACLTSAASRVQRMRSCHWGPGLQEVPVQEYESYQTKTKADVITISIVYVKNMVSPSAHM